MSAPPQNENDPYQGARTGWTRKPPPHADSDDDRGSTRNDNRREDPQYPAMPAAKGPKESVVTVRQVPRSGFDDESPVTSPKAPKRNLKKTPLRICRYFCWVFPPLLFVVSSVIACMTVAATYQQLGSVAQVISDARHVDSLWEKSPFVVLIISALMSALVLGLVFNELITLTASRRRSCAALALWALFPLLWLVLGISAAIGCWIKHQTGILFWGIATSCLLVLTCYAAPFCCCCGGRRPAEYIKRIRRSAAFLNLSAKLFCHRHTLCHTSLGAVFLLVTLLVHIIWFVAQAGLAVDLFIKLGQAQQLAQDTQSRFSNIVSRDAQYNQADQVGAQSDVNTQMQARSFSSTTQTQAGYINSSPEHLEGLEKAYVWCYNFLHLGHWAAFLGLSIFFFISFIWLHQVIHNIFHFVISSKYSLYLRGTNDFVFWKTLRAALSHSFPTIAIGSLYLSIFSVPQCLAQLICDPNRPPPDPGKEWYNERILNCLTCCVWPRSPTRSLFSAASATVGTQSANSTEKSTDKDQYMRQGGWDIDRNADYVDLSVKVDRCIKTSISYSLATHSLIEPFFLFVSLLSGAACATEVGMLLLMDNAVYFTEHYGVVACSLLLVAFFTGFHFCYILMVPLQSVFDTLVAVLATYDDYRYGARNSVLQLSTIDQLDGNYARLFLNVDPDARLEHAQQTLQNWFDGALADPSNSGHIPKRSFRRTRDPWMFEGGWSLLRPTTRQKSGSGNDASMAEKGNMADLPGSEAYREFGGNPYNSVYSTNSNNAYDTLGDALRRAQAASSTQQNPTKPPEKQKKGARGF